MAPKEDTAHRDAKSVLEHSGVSFAATAAKRLFTTEIAEGTELGNNVPAPQEQNDISKLTVLMPTPTSAKHTVLHNAEPPGKTVGQSCDEVKPRPHHVYPTAPWNGRR
jgi:hypothetical protein